MGFLSNLARQIVDTDDDDKAAEIIRRNTMPPPPRQPIVVSDGPPPPGASMPPPKPYISETSLGGPPPGTTEYNIDELDRMWHNMMPPPPTTAPNVPEPSTTSITPAGEPPPIVTGTYMPPPPNVYVGREYKGMSPTQKAATHLQVLQSAAPESKVTDTGSTYEVEPPKKMGRAEGAGKGLLTLLTAGAQYGIGGMAGAGLYGLGLGLADPTQIQKIKRHREISQAQQEYATNLGMDEAALQNQTRQITNAATLAHLEDADQDRAIKMNEELRQEYKEGLSNIENMQKRQALLDPHSAQYKAAEAAIQQEADRVSKRTGRKVTVIPGNPALNQLPHVELDGEMLQLQHDGSWMKVYGSSKSAVEDANADQHATYQWQVKNAENAAKRNAAMQDASSFESAAADHQKKVTAAAASIKSIEDQMKQVQVRAVGPTPQYDILKQQLETQQRIMSDEQRKMDEAYKSAESKKAEAAQYPDMPPPPQRVRRGASQSLSKSAWLASHPGGDWNVALAEANRRQIPIIP
jgi:hypothetical protein